MKIDPNTSLGIIYQQYEEVLAENALKLTQILDLENDIQELQRENSLLNLDHALKFKQIIDLQDLIYILKAYEMKDSSPCWCVEYEDSTTHSPICIKARQVTEHLWKK